MHYGTAQYSPPCPLCALFWRLSKSQPFPTIRNLWSQLVWKTQLGFLGEDSYIYSTIVIHCPERVSIGSRVSIAEFVHMWGGGGITIGNDVMIAAHTIISSQTHDPNAPLFRETQIMKPVVIEDNVWIGSGAIILPGVHIGTGSVIGAGSVVTKDVPPGSVVVGGPSKVIRQLGQGGGQNLSD
jgi:Acetyltransferase (isoleucine patch superfamily)